MRVFGCCFGLGLHKQTECLPKGPSQFSHGNAPGRGIRMNSVPEQPAPRRPSAKPWSREEPASEHGLMVCSLDCWRRGRKSSPRQARERLSGSKKVVGLCRWMRMRGGERGGIEEGERGLSERIA